MFIPDHYSWSHITTYQNCTFKYLSEFLQDFQPVTLEWYDTWHWYTLLHRLLEKTCSYCNTHCLKLAQIRRQCVHRCSTTKHLLSLTLVLISPCKNLDTLSEIFKKTWNQVSWRRPITDISKCWKVMSFKTTAIRLAASRPPLSDVWDWHISVPKIII